jgi:hypothetical protein
MSSKNTYLNQSVLFLENIKLFCLKHWILVFALFDLFRKDKLLSFLSNGAIKEFCLFQMIATILLTQLK